MKRLLLLASLVPCTFALVPVSAADVKVSGLIFAQYEAVTSKYLKDGTKADGRNAFDVSRIYLNAGAPLNERMSSFLQLEGNLLSRENTENQVYVKQALLEYKEVYPGARLLFGLVPTPWRSFEEGIWKHRFVAKILEDEEGLMNATDRGVRLSGTAPRLAYDLMVSNGEGTGGRSAAGNEPSKHKEFTGKATVAPFSEGGLSGLKISLQGVNGQKGAHWPRDRALGGLSFASGRFSAMGTYVVSRDGQGVAAGTDTVKGAGFSVHAVLGVSETCWVFARYDRWDPDTSSGDNARSRYIVGAGHALAESVRLAVDYQALIQQKEAATRRDQGIAALHLEVKF